MDFGSILIATVIMSKYVAGLLLLSFSTILLLMLKVGIQWDNSETSICEQRKKQIEDHMKSLMVVAQKRPVKRNTNG